jgi:hypothetical protein
MNFDPIVEEIHEIRAKLSSQYGDDLHSICEALRGGQDAKKHPLITRPPRPALQNVYVAPKPLLQQSFDR